ncbi:hypothetical protein HZB97_02750 [Candidatus Gottesmanbacteria bacterium]|nr:hypothetical protein [Candidatus Gottesmanbacteria bacterium]
MEKNFPQGERGQVLLIVLLVMVVGLTIGLSLATRSVTDIKISTQLEQSSQAFSAAEAGLEAALKGETAGTYTIGNTTYTFSTTTSGGTDAPLSLGKVSVADTYTVWLTNHDGDGNLQIGESYDYDGSSIDVCWDQGAMETTVLYKDGTTYKVSRGAYDPSSDRRANNKFSDVEGGINCGGGFAFGKRINLPSSILLALRLRAFYSDANVGVAPQTGQALPSQGIDISSTGTAGETTRKISIRQNYPSLPPIFDYVLFSGGGASK